jgi:hypothetical protein
MFLLIVKPDSPQSDVVLEHTGIKTDLQRVDVRLRTQQWYRCRKLFDFSLATLPSISSFVISEVDMLRAGIQIV